MRYVIGVTVATDGGSCSASAGHRGSDVGRPLASTTVAHGQTPRSVATS